MSSLTISLISVACIFGGALVGMWLRRVMPKHHLLDDSRETIKVGSGMIATLAALVLGLLVGSSKGSFDSTNTLVTQAAAKKIMLDGLLANYDPETKPMREQLRHAAVGALEIFWPEEKIEGSELSKFEKANAMEVIRAELRKLAPAPDAQKQLLAEANSATGDLLQMRWLLIEQAQSSLPTLLVVILLFWLTVLHLSFGLLAPGNPTAVTVLLISSISLAGAILLILEMNHPLEGMVKVPSAPLRKALQILHAQMP